MIYYKPTPQAHNIVRALHKEELRQRGKNEDQEERMDDADTNRLGGFRRGGTGRVRVGGASFSVLEKKTTNHIIQTCVNTCNNMLMR